MFNLQEGNVKLLLWTYTLQKILYYNIIQTLNFEIITCFWIKTVIVEEEVLKCIMAIIDYRKSMIHMTLKIGIFYLLLNAIIFC